MRAWLTPSSHLHIVPAGFPETPERLDWAVAACERAGVPVARPSIADLAGLDPGATIDSVHPDGRLQRLREAAVPWRGRIDTADCPVSPGTPDAAMAAVRTTLLALAEVVSLGDAGIALVRPPGHHATPRAAMGFCYMNNIAIAAREAQRLGRRRIVIVDIDVHHGNGTQETFYEDRDVFFASLHEDPRLQYPGTGFPQERGAGAGLGTILNIPLGRGTGGEAYLQALAETVVPALEAHRAELLLVSAGFDTHRADPLGGFRLEAADFRRIGELLGGFAARQGIPALHVLEGGYSPVCFLEGLLPLVEGWRSAVEVG